MSDNRNPDGRMFWTCFVLGGSVSLFGIWTLLLNADRNKPLYTAVLAIGFNIVHDAVIAPLVCAIGFAIRKTVPEPIRTQVTWALFTSAAVVAVGLAPLRGYGRDPDNETVLPLDYSTSVLTVLAVVWGIAAVCSVLSLRKRRAVDGA